MTTPEKCLILEHPTLPGVTVTFEIVTPAIAQEWLDLNSEAQRKISPATVDRYTGDMAAGQWIFNGATVLFNKAGFICDGQHRLKAVVESEEAQTLLVCRGIDPEAMLAIDAGRRRNFADTLRIRGVSRHRLCAAITGRFWFWEHGAYGTRGQARGDDDTYLNSNPSNAQLHAMWPLAEARFDVTIEQAAIEGERLYRARPGFATSTYGLAWLLLSGVDKDLREAFWHELIVEPKSASAKYPINCLTNSLARRQEEKWDHVEQLHHLFNVYNKWIRNEELSFLRMPAPRRPGTLAIPVGFTQPALLSQ